MDNGCDFEIINNSFYKIMWDLRKIECIKVLKLDSDEYVFLEIKFVIIIIIKEDFKEKEFVKVMKIRLFFKIELNKVKFFDEIVYNV